MLLVGERNKAIELLVVQHSSMSYNNNPEFVKMLTNGFRGFASFSDKELIRCLYKFRDIDYGIKNFLDNIVVEEMLLGDR